MLEPSTETTGRPWWKLAAGAVGLVLLILVGREVGGRLPEVAREIDALGYWGPLVFVIVYALATVAFVPGSLLTLAAGATFGIVEGTLWVFVAATLGATGAFLVGRYLARGTVERRLADSPRFAAIDRAVGKEGLKIVFLLRLSPVFPFNALNYLLGLTRVKLGHYLLACFGMIPGTLLYVYYGKVAGDVAALAGGVRPERGWEYWLFLGLGLLATLAVTVVVTRTARRALRETTDIDLDTPSDSKEEGA